MRLLIILSIIVILLLAVSWFKPAYCNTLDSEQLLKEYLKRGKSTTSSTKSENSYTSPDIYGKDIKNQGIIPDSLAADSLEMPDKTMPPAYGRNVQSDSLMPFGYSLFEASSELSSTPDVADLADYILGPGDNIIIYLWGKVEKEFNLTVDRQGKVFIPKIGEIVVWGMTLSDFESKVNQQLSAIYSDFKSSVSLGKIRSIRIYLTGEVVKPGAYTVSSLTTLFNALYLAGGPNLRGSMRNIKLIRNNKTETSVDLYQFLLKGDSKSDVRLSSGDAIFIPVSGPRVSIRGEIKRPAIYEILGGEKISQLMELAGGTTAAAYLDHILLDRISPKDERVIIELNLNRNNGERIDDIELADGDNIKICSLYDMKRNLIAVAGMVKHPGEYERTDSTTLKDLIFKGELLPENVYMERANLFRRFPDNRVQVLPINLQDVLDGRYNMALQDMDSLHIYAIDEVKRKMYVYIDGEVNRPGQYPLYDNMTLGDLVFLAGDLKKNAYQMGVEMARTDSAGQVHLEYVDLSESRMKNYILQEDDRVFIRQMPDWFLHKKVSIEGEVKFPGAFALYSRNETIYDLIKRAGGFTDRAFPKGVIFQRQTVGESLIRRNVPEIIANSQPLEQDSTGQIRKMEVVNFKLERMNRIIIDMDKIIASDGKEGNITLQNGDYIFVPEIPSGISVMGAVGANGTIKFDDNQNVKYYIRRAGNFTNQADKNGTKLIKADGQAYSGGGTLGKKVEIGDAIVVPTEIRKEHDMLKTVSTAISILGGVMTSVFIITKL
jgi:protein involved in polysaccharide export with SLBB domain